MAIVATNATVAASSGLGPVTYICTVDTGTVTVAAACAALAAQATIAGVSGTGNGAYVLVQGGATPSVSGVTVVATI